MAKAFAIKKGQLNVKPPAEYVSMGTVRCEGCGEEFMITQHPAISSSNAAERQAHWLERVLADEHERDRKHPEKIELPE